MPAGKLDRLLLGFCLGGIVLILAAGSLDLITGFQREYRQNTERLRQFSQRMTEHLGQHLQSIDTLNREIVTALGSRAALWQDWQAFRGWEFLAAKRSRTLPYLQELLLVDERGETRFSSARIQGRPHYPVLGAAAERFSDGAGRWVTGAVINPNNNQTAFLLVHPVTGAASRVAGMAVALVDPAEFQEFCWPQRLAGDFEAVLINDAEQILASCRPSHLGLHADFIGKTLNQVLSEGGEDFPQQGVVERGGRVVLIQPLPGFPELRLLTLMPRADLTAQARARGVWVAVLCLGVSFLLFFGMQQVRRRLGVFQETLASQLASVAGLQAELQETAGALAVERANTARADAAKSRFLAAASHDLRQPLQALALYSADLKQQSLLGHYGDIPRIAGQIAESTQGLGEMLNALLDLSRLDMEGVQVDISDFCLATVFQRLETAFARTAEAKGQRLVFFPSRSRLHSDPRLLERMLANLIANALRYTPRGGRILVGCRQKGAYVQVEVRDNGIGIPAGEQAAIFSEFYQVANVAREQKGGLGLGLSIVERLARALDIELTLVSAIAAGSCFGLRIPRSAAAVCCDAGNEAATVSATLHFVGMDEDLEACRTLATAWGYACVDCPPGGGELRQPGAVVCKLLPDFTVDREIPCIVLGEAPEAGLPAGIHHLGLPLRAARLRALLRALLPSPSPGEATGPDGGRGVPP